MLRQRLPVYIAVIAMISRWRNVESFPPHEINKQAAEWTTGSEADENSYNVHRTTEISLSTALPAADNEQSFAAHNAIPSPHSRRRHTVPRTSRHRPVNAFTLPKFSSRHPSDLIVFADRHPSMPPLSFITATKNDVTIPVAKEDLIPTNTSTRERQPKASLSADDEQAISRRRRSVTAPRSGFPHPHQNRHHHQQQQPSLIPVCASVSEWVQRTDAEDFLGNRVRLVQDIDNGSSRVGQYFFETYCSGGGGGTSGHRHHHHGSCNGIDSSQYESVCYETHSFVYGLVSDYSRSGEGWTFVKIRTGCNCGLLARRSVDGGRQSSSWQSRRSSK